MEEDPINYSNEDNKTYIFNTMNNANQFVGEDQYSFYQETNRTMKAPSSAFYPYNRENNLKVLKLFQ